MTSISTSNAVSTTSIQFHGQSIITTMIAGVAYVAMRPIVENIGIDWAGQTVKLKNQKEKFNCCDIAMVAADKKIRDVLCIPLRKLNGWLFSINPQRVRADIRDKLIQYQEECFAVLHEYWTKGEVTKKTKTRQSTATQLTPLRQTAERLITTGLGKIYPDIWKLVHDRFGIEHIHQLSPVQISEAVEYLNVLEGEYLGKSELPSRRTGITLDDHQLYSVYVLTVHFKHLYDIYKKYDLHGNLKGLGSRAGIEMHDHFVDGSWQLSSLRQLDDEFDAVQRRLKINRYSTF